MILSDASARTEFVAEFKRLANWAEPNSNPSGELFATTEDELFPGAVLPRCKGGQMLYYAVADTASDWRTLTALLRAFVGFTLTDFTGPVSDVRHGDEVERWLAAHPFAGMARFGASGDARRGPATAGGLLRLRDCLHRPGAPRRSLPRTTPRVLSDFRLALVNQDRAAAEEAMAFLAANMRLDAMNLRFLAVQLRAAFGEWQELHDEPFFSRLCDTRRAPATSAALAEAVYHVMLEPAEAAGGAETTLRAFKERVLKGYGNLFETLPVKTSAGAAKAFLLAAAVKEPPDRPMAERLVEQKQNWTVAEQEAFDSLRTALFPKMEVEPERPTGSQGVSLGSLLEHGPDAAPPPTIGTARAVLWEAIKLQSLDGYRVALEYLERLPGEDLQVLRATPGIAGMLADISRLAVRGRVPGNWGEWLEMLPEIGISQAREWAEKAAAEWPIGKHLQTAEDVRELVNALMSVPREYEERLYDALPELVLWVTEDPQWPNPAYLSLYECLVLLLVMSSRRTPRALDATGSLLEGMLSTGLSRSRYGDLLSNLGELVRQLRGYGYVDWLIDLAEVVARYAAPDEEARVRLWSQIVEVLRPLGAELTRSQRAVLGALRVVPGIAELLATPSAEAPPPPRALPHGYTIGVYTLTPGVAQQIENILNESYTGFRVASSDAHVANRQLEELARGADLMVVYTRSAAHAATGAIRQNRPRHLPTIYAGGKGPMRVLGEIQGYLDRAAANAAA